MNPNGFLRGEIPYYFAACFLPASYTPTTSGFTNTKTPWVPCAASDTPETCHAEAIHAYTPGPALAARSGDAPASDAHHGAPRSDLSSAGPRPNLEAKAPARRRRFRKATGRAAGSFRRSHVLNSWDLYVKKAGWRLDANLRTPRKGATSF